MTTNGKDIEKRIEESNVKGHCLMALKGDVVKTYKGRKYAKDTCFVVDHFEEWRDLYGRVQTIYVVDQYNRRVDSYNCKIIRHIG